MEQHADFPMKLGQPKGIRLPPFFIPANFGQTSLTEISGLPNDDIDDNDDNDNDNDSDNYNHYDNHNDNLES